MDEFDRDTDALGTAPLMARIAKRACDNTQKLGHNPNEWIGVCSGVFCCRDRWRPSDANRPAWAKLVERVYNKSKQYWRSDPIGIVATIG